MFLRRKQIPAGSIQCYLFTKFFFQKVLKIKGYNMMVIATSYVMFKTKISLVPKHVINSSSSHEENDSVDQSKENGSDDPQIDNPQHTQNLVSLYGVRP